MGSSGVYSSMSRWWRWSESAGSYMQGAPCMISGSLAEQGPTQYSSTARMSQSGSVWCCGRSGIIPPPMRCCSAASKSAALAKRARPRPHPWLQKQSRRLREGDTK